MVIPSNMITMGFDPSPYIGIFKANQENAWEWIINKGKVRLILGKYGEEFTSTFYGFVWTMDSLAQSKQQSMLVNQPYRGGLICNRTGELTTMGSNIVAKGSLSRPHKIVHIQSHTYPYAWNIVIYSICFLFVYIYYHDLLLLLLFIYLFTVFYLFIYFIYIFIYHSFLF